MKRLTAVILCLMLCGTLLAGCGIGQKKEEETTTAAENDAAVLGTWSEDYFDSGYIFNSDGTGRDMFWDLSFTYTALDGVLTITYDDSTYGIDKYSYSATETSLTLDRQSSERISYTYTKR